MARIADSADNMIKYQKNSMNVGMFSLLNLNRFMRKFHPFQHIIV